MLHRVRCHCEGEVIVDSATAEGALRIAAQVIDEGAIDWTRTLLEVTDERVVLVTGVRYWVEDDEEDGGAGEPNGTG